MVEGQGKPIWYFVGLILMLMGGIILCTGVYYFLNPTELKTVLAETHPNIWWGGIMLLFGFVLYWKTK